MSDNLIKRWRYIEEEDKYYCDGDCWSWDFGVCTCGLYNALQYTQDLSKLAHWDTIKHRHQKTIRDLLLCNPPEKITHCPHNVHLNTKCESCILEFEKALKDFEDWCNEHR